jgi:hypothetical protein
MRKVTLISTKKVLVGFIYSNENIEPSPYLYLEINCCTQELLNFRLKVGHFEKTALVVWKKILFSYRFI